MKNIILIILCLCILVCSSINTYCCYMYQRDISRRNNKRGFQQQGDLCQDFVRILGYRAKRIHMLHIDCMQHHDNLFRGFQLGHLGFFCQDLLGFCVYHAKNIRLLRFGCTQHRDNFVGVFQMGHLGFFVRKYTKKS